MVIAIPALGTPVLAPEGALDPTILEIIGEHARAAADGAELPVPPPAPMTDAVPVRMADAVVGIAAALAPASPNGSAPVEGPERRAWLEAAATATSVTALIRDAHGAAPRARPGSSCSPSWPPDRPRTPPPSWPAPGASASSSATERSRSPAGEPTGRPTRSSRRPTRTR